MPTTPTPTDRPADVLRAAATKLRTAADAVGSAPGISSTWEADGTTVWQGRFPDGEFVYPVADAASPQCGAYIALMHPGVGLAVARWLESWAGVDLSEHGPMPEDAQHALAVARQLLGTTETEGAAPDPTTADDPTPLRWGLGDTLWGDDNTVTVCMSGPNRKPYWLELDPDRAAALREDLAGPPADAAPAALPVPADRAAALREAAEHLVARANQDTERGAGVLWASAELRRLADEAAAEPVRRRLTPGEHDRAWHAIEGSAGEPGADPSTVLAAVLHALRIDAPTAEEEQAASLRLRHRLATPPAAPAATKEQQ